MGLFNRRERTVNLLESSIQGLTVENLSLKEYAIDLCAGYMARIFSQSSFLIDDKRWSYRLNVKPNENQSGAEFWRDVIFRLFKEGEALVILSDNNMLLLADGFDEREYDLYPNSYHSVTVGSYTFKRVFKANEVLHFRLKNEKLRLFTESVYHDYEKLISNMFISSQISNQLRFKIKIPRMNLSKSDSNANETLAKEYVKKISESAIVSLPTTESIDYEEVNNPDKQSLSVSPLDEALWAFVDKIATMIGIPPVLLHGDVAGSSEAQRLFNINCLEPLNQLIENEINAKIFSESSYSDKKAVNILGANRPDVFDMAESIDKLISSGSFNRNEIRLLLGYPTVEGLDEFVITKNYETNEPLKGGENEDDSEVLQHQNE